uniref:Uncharacterized protein n=1 Tax=Meloidogyne enterolobii TaxID=390850 RepID=A0A6V7UKA2_MELEN|nr:unnamed protein product [Meloidogyne enterolobii]
MWKYFFKKVYCLYTHCLFNSQPTSLLPKSSDTRTTSRVHGTTYPFIGITSPTVFIAKHKITQYKQ